jgi:hypothetical protein
VICRMRRTVAVAVAPCNTTLARWNGNASRENSRYIANK